MIERAEGPWLYTRDGRKILDAGAGAVVVNIGQGREELARLAADEVRAPQLCRPRMVLACARAPDRTAGALDPART